LLSLLDLSAAFDAVDHPVIVERLRHTYGLTAQALNWISSYLSGRTQFVRYNGKTSSVMPVSSGLCVHEYADILQIYGHADPSQSAELMAHMGDCITSVQTWLASNQLKLNPAKTDVVRLGTTSSPAAVHL